MPDMSDYCQCQICKSYEVCLIVQGLGKESGLFGCENGHAFCKDCYPKFLDTFEKEVYNDISFIRSELKKYIDDSKDLRYADHECIDEYETWLKMDDSDLIKIVRENNVFDEMLCEMPKEYCPICNSPMRYSDGEIVRYLLNKHNVTRDQIAKEMDEKIKLR